MADFTLSMLDTTGIQNYIFGSNRLQENIGASELVYRATTLWAFEALDQFGLRHNVRIIDREAATWEMDKQRLEDDANLDAELIYAGGGNTFIMFRHSEQAIAFTRSLTHRVLKEAPRLTVVACHLDFDPERHRLCDKRDELQKELAKRKQARLPSTPLLGLGVTAICQSTGLIAIQTNEELKSEQDEIRLISREIVSKLQAKDLALDRLKKMIGKDLSNWFDFPYEIDKLGRQKGEESFVAVVHIDGNRMSEHLSRISQTIDWQDIKKSNCDYLLKLREFSQKVEKAGQMSLTRVVKQLVMASRWDDQRKGYFVADEVPLEAYYLPFRPLVFGGDDVTFVANARLGLALTTAYLDYFEQETANLGLDNMHACAGISMVKMHYPFARAYRLSGDLCKSAKRYVRREADGDCSALDWHFTTVGLEGSLKMIRQREYTLLDGEELMMRPVRLRAAADTQDGRYWENGIERLVREFQNSPDWQNRRNKVKGLREPLRNGTTAVQTYRRNFELPQLPELLPGDRSHRQTGWSGKRCVYFDALELLDHYVSLPV